MAESKFLSGVKLRPIRLVQCGYCNRWHEPEALDLDGECDVCNVLLPLREELRTQIGQGLGQSDEAARIRQDIKEVLGF